MPIWITSNFKIRGLKKGQLILKRPYRKNIILGAGGSRGLQEMHGGLYMTKGARLILHGFTVISQGTVLRIDENATIEIGRNFYSNKNCFLHSTDKIIFGNDCSLGWNIQISTTDGHVIRHQGLEVDMAGTIVFGDNVWLTSNCVITKKVHIANGCMVAQGAVVVHSVDEEKVLIGGVPARVILHDIEWEK